MGFWFFNPKNFEKLDGKHIEKLSIEVRRRSGGAARYVDVNIIPHNLTERTAYQPEFINGRCYRVSIEPHECITRDVFDKELFEAIQDGMVLGFGVQQLEDQYDSYAVLDSSLTLRFTIGD